MGNKKITVIFGAGASYDCLPYPPGNAFKPRLPLTDDLFRIGTVYHHRILKLAHDLLIQFPGASHIGYLHEHQRVASKAQSLEDYLKDLYKNGTDNVRKNIREIPFFLRSYLGQAGNLLLSEFRETHYEILLHYLDRSDYSEILLLTLNYDGILDKALHKAVGWQRKDMKSYVRHQNRFSYIKFHGSVDWIRKVPPDAIKRYEDSSESLFSKLGDLADTEPEGLDSFGVEHSDNYEVLSMSPHFFRFPVMVLPNVTEKKYICPDFHAKVVCQILSECEDFLIIGNSMRDSDIQDVIKKNAQKAKRVKCIDSLSDNGTKLMLERLRTCLPNADIYPWRAGFSEYISQRIGREKHIMSFD